MVGHTLVGGRANTCNNIYIIISSSNNNNNNKLAEKRRSGEIEKKTKKTYPYFFNILTFLFLLCSCILLTTGQPSYYHNFGLKIVSSSRLNNFSSYANSDGRIHPAILCSNRKTIRGALFACAGTDLALAWVLNFMMCASFERFESCIERRVCNSDFQIVV